MERLHGDIPVSNTVAFVFLALAGLLMAKAVYDCLKTPSLSPKERYFCLAVIVILPVMGPWFFYFYRSNFVRSSSGR